MQSVGVILLSIVAALVPILFSDNSVLTTIGLVIVSGFLFLIIRSWTNGILFLVAFVLGTLAEAFAVHAGILTFRKPDFYGIPMWLSFTWGDTALVVAWIKERLDANPKSLSS